MRHWNPFQHWQKKVNRDRAAFEQGGVCIYCLQPFGADRPATFEHIVPVSRGGTFDRDNCCASCRPCNAERGSRDHGAFLRFKRGQVAREAENG